MTDADLFDYNSTTRNNGAGSTANPRCFYLDPLNDYEPEGFLYIESVVTTIVNMICSLIATSGNAIVIVTFYKSHHLRSQSHLLLWCLAFADFATGLIVQPFYGAYKIAYLTRQVSTSCVLRIILETFAWFSAAISCALFAAITGERYLALHYHLRYHEVITTRKILMYIAFVVTTPAILSLSRFALNGVEPFLYINIFGLLFSLLVLLISYWKIYKQVHRHFRLIQAQSTIRTDGQSLDVQRFKKSVINMAYVSVLYMISYLPFTCVLFAYLSFGFTSHVEAAYDITRTMCFMPSWWNPFLYFWKMHELRLAVKNVMRRDSMPYTEEIELSNTRFTA